MPRLHLWSESRLRNGVNDWKEITPQPLQRAVEALRRNFQQHERKIDLIMMQGCNPALHKGSSEEARKISRPLEQTFGYEAFPTVDEGQTEPAVFSSYFYRCAQLLAGALRITFFGLRDISLAQATLIDRPPLDWAAVQVKVLVADKSHRISLWLKSSCDKFELVDDESWRAPRWLFMEPFGNQPYDRGHAWDRMNETETEHVQEVVEDRFNQLLVMELDRAVDEAHVELAIKAPNNSVRAAPSAASELEEHTARKPTKGISPRLTARQEKIWGVIQQNVRGLAYCRELDNAGVRPPRKGVWAKGPGTYCGAYREGESWPHRIQDEKTKIKKKAERAKLARKLAGE